MKRLLCVAVLIVCTGALAGADSATNPVPHIGTYDEAMRCILAEIDILVGEVDAERDELIVVYTVGDDAPPPEFVVGVVLRLAIPLARGVQLIRLRNVSDGDTLLELQVRLEQVETLLASTVSEEQREEISALLAKALAAPRANRRPRAPRATAPDTPESVVRAVPIGGSPVDAGEDDILSDTSGLSATGASGAQDAIGPTMGRPVAVTDAQTLAAALLSALEQEDLENLSVSRDAENQWIVTFENRTWRSDIQALSRALAAVADTLPGLPVSVQIKRHDVVVSHVRVDTGDYVKMEAGIISPGELTSNWRVMAGSADVAEPVEVLARGNDSDMRVDLLVRPALKYEIGLEHDPFVSDCFLVSDLWTTLGTGLWANLRLPAQLTANQGIDMDRALIGWVGRPTNGILATASLGRFGEALHGMYVEARTDSEHHQWGLVGSLTSSSHWINPFDASSNAVGYYQHDFGALALNARLGYGQFLESDDTGVTLSLRRRFGESFIAAHATRTDDGAEGLKFELSMPFGPHRASAPDALRARTNPAVSIDYVSNFGAYGDYLRGPQDLESFRGELSPAYLGSHGEKLVDHPSTMLPDWPAAPSYEGSSGLMRIPTADVLPDGRLFAGVSYFDRDHSKVIANTTDAMPAFVGAGFLPNLELVGRLTFFHDVKAFDWDFNLDRSFNAHYRLNRQRGDWFPAFAIGAQDVTFGTSTSYLGTAEYLVGTLRRDNLRAHIGIGSGRFSPIFGGFDMAVEDGSRLHLMAEYDSDYINAGARWFLDDWGTASIGLLGLEALTGSISFETDLQ